LLREGGRFAPKYAIAEERKADAVFAKPEVYEYLVPRDIGYAIRLPASEVLRERIKYLLRQPVGKPPNKPIVRPHFSQESDRMPKLKPCILVVDDDMQVLSLVRDMLKVEGYRVIQSHVGRPDGPRYVGSTWGYRILRSGTCV